MPPTDPPLPAETVTLARHAMATRFELILHGTRAPNLRAAGEEALGEIQRLETQLNLHSNHSELAQLNARAARQPVKVEPGLFRILQTAQRIHQETAGAFDVTVAPLMKCWGFVKGHGRLPDLADLARARDLVGMHHVELDPDRFTVRFTRPGVTLDLGSIGKGYALEAAAEILRENGVANALIHGGTSTVCALGQPPDQPAWKVAVEFTEPDPDTDSAAAPDPSANRLLAVVPLRDQALSVSAVWGKAFQSGTKTLGHIIDPRSGQPADRAMLAAVVLPSATETDAYSTALLIGGHETQEFLSGLRPEIGTLIAGRSEPGTAPWVQFRGIDRQIAR